MSFLIPLVSSVMALLKSLVTTVPDYFLVQFLTGHGNFRAELNGFRLVVSPECGLGMPQV